MSNQELTGLLNIGCGANATGDVNLDLYVEDTENHRNSAEFLKLNVRAIQNFVRGDAQYLPFKDNAFEVVFSAQVIEHVKNPFLMLREMARVAKKK